MAFLPSVQCAEELQGTYPERKNKPSETIPEIVQTQSWLYKTILVIKRQQQTTISQKNNSAFQPHTVRLYAANLRSVPFVSLAQVLLLAWLALLFNV